MKIIKLITSLNLVLKGAKISQSAYDTGFWDASHMNRSYRELLGITPGAIRKYEKELKIISCTGSNFYTFRTEILKDWGSDKPFKTIDYFLDLVHHPYKMIVQHIMLLSSSIPSASHH